MGLVSWLAGIMPMAALGGDCCTHGNLCHKCDLPICIPSGPPFGYNPTIWNRWPIQVIDEKVISTEAVAPGGEVPAAQPTPPVRPPMSAPTPALPPTAPVLPPQPSASPSDEAEPAETGEPGVREEPAETGEPGVREEPAAPKASSSLRASRPLPAIARRAPAPIRQAQPKRPVVVEQYEPAPPMPVPSIVQTPPAAPAVEQQVRLLPPSAFVSEPVAARPTAADMAEEEYVEADDEFTVQPAQEVPVADEIPIRQESPARTAGRTPVVVPVDVEPSDASTAKVAPRRQRFWIFAAKPGRGTKLAKRDEPAHRPEVRLFDNDDDVARRSESQVRQASATSIGSFLKPIVHVQD